LQLLLERGLRFECHSGSILVLLAAVETTSPNCMGNSFLLVQWLRRRLGRNLSNTRWRDGRTTTPTCAKVNLLACLSFANRLCFRRTPY